MRHTLATSAGTQRVLERSSGSLYSFGHLLCNCSCHQTTKCVAHNNSAHSTTWFLQSCHPPSSNDGQGFGWHFSLGEEVAQLTKGLACCRSLTQAVGRGARSSCRMGLVLQTFHRRERMVRSGNFHRRAREKSFALGGSLRGRAGRLSCQVIAL